MSRLAAVVVAAGALAAAGLSTAASASTHPKSAAATKAAAAKAALKGVHTAIHPGKTAIHPGKDVKGATSEDSTNWSGYADTGTNFNKVTSSWTQPKITCPTDELQLAAFWVGIDGWGSGTVEQDGTLAECYEGTAYYYTWWEMYPQVDIETVGDTVKPGDTIDASVVLASSGKYTLKVTDTTTSGNNLSTVQTCASGCENTSDEVIGEAPGGERGEFPLPDFAPWTPGSIVFATTSKTGDVSTFTPTYKITMIGDDNYALATPSALSSGNKFTDTWDNSFGPMR
jgi:hypothetical protein